MNAKVSHDTVCNGKYHTVKWEEQDIIKCDVCGFAPRNEYETEEEYNEIMEKVFNEPYPKGVENGKY